MRWGDEREIIRHESHWEYYDDDNAPDTQAAPRLPPTARTLVTSAGTARRNFRDAATHIYVGTSDDVELKKGDPVIRLDVSLDNRDDRLICIANSANQQFLVPADAIETYIPSEV